MIGSRPGARLHIPSAYGVALVAPLVIYAFCLSLEGTGRDYTPLSLFLLAVIPAAWLGGAGPGLLATGVGLLLGKFILASQDFSAVDQVGRLAVIGIVGVVISLLYGNTRRAQTTLNRERAQLSALLDNIPGGAMLAEAPGGRIVLANRKVKEILGHSFDTPNVSTYTQWRMTYPDGRVLTAEEYPLARALRGESISGGEYLYRHEAGRDIWLRASAAPVRGPDGDVTGGVVLFWDNEAEKRLGSELHLERERIRLAYAAARVGSFEWNIVTGENLWSPEIEALYGVPAGGFEGNYSAWRQRVHPDDVVRAESDVQRALEQGNFHSHWRAVLPDGSVRYLEAFGRVVFDAAGRPERMLGVNVDVTAREEAQHELRSARIHLEQALEAGRLGAWHLDLATGQMTCTAGCKANYGRKPTERFDYPDLLGAIHEDDLPEMQSAVRRAIESRTSYRAEYRVRWPDGSVHWILARGEAQYDDAGTAITMDGVTADITERRALEEQLRSQAEELREADRRKDRFLATLSHELRNPLQAIGASVGLLQYAADRPDAAARAGEVIARQAGQIARLVDDLLEVARIAEGKLVLDRRLIDVATIIAAAAETVRPQFERRRQTLHLDAAVLQVHGDASRLTQVMINLLNNASKYTGEGGVVEVIARAADGMATIRVRDNGIGIPEAMLTKVFDVFTQVEQHHQHAAGGLGIGLNVVRRLVEHHGGTVTAHSDGPGRGAEFVVRLALAAVSAQSGRPAAEFSSRADQSSDLLSSAQSRRGAE
jgi:PAS domain S-box-containing protein